MATIGLLFVTGYFFHLGYKLIDNLIIMAKNKRHESKGELDNAA